MLSLSLSLIWFHFIVPVPLGDIPNFVLYTGGEEAKLYMHDALYNTVVNFRLLPQSVWTSSHRAPIALFQGNTTMTQRPPSPANGDQFPWHGHIKPSAICRVKVYLSNLSLSFHGPLLDHGFHFWKPSELGCFRNTQLEALTGLSALSDFCIALLFQGPQCPEVISSSTESLEVAWTCPYFSLHAYSTALHYVLFLNMRVSLHFSLFKLLGFNSPVRDTWRQLDKGSLQSPVTVPIWSLEDEENVLLPQVKSHSLLSWSFWYSVTQLYQFHKKFDIVNRCNLLSCFHLNPLKS